jgi:AraC-like DNA-binding protein
MAAMSIPPSRIFAPDEHLCLADAPLRQVRRQFVSPDYVMVLVTRGHGVYLDETTGSRYPIATGDIMQRFPGRAHAQFFADTGNRQFFLKVPATMYYLLRERGVLDPACVLSMDGGAARGLFERCLASCRSLADPADGLWRIKDLIVALHRRARPASGGNDAIATAQRLLLHHGDERLALPAIAGRLALSYAHFRRLFRERIGIPPGAWLIRQRLERASHLLSTDEFSITDISAMLRYPDVQSFSKQFRQRYGMSPTAYRQQARSGRT